VLDAIEGAVAGSDQPQVGPAGPGLPEPVVLAASVQDAQQPGLLSLRQLGDLIQEERAAVRLSDEAGRSTMPGLG